MSSPLDPPRPPRKPDLFIVGAPKSGTTSLYDYLAGHPQIYMSPVKEPLYFAPDVRPNNERSPAHRANEDAYLALFSDATTEVRLGEATTRYLVSHAAPGLIRAFQPEAFIVVMLRNPVEMLHALHNERVAQGHEPIATFGAALAADAARPLAATYLEHGRYAEQLERWLAVFGRERIHVVVFDDFAADTAGAFKAVLEFLEVDPDYRPDSFAPRNVSHRPRRLVRNVVESRPGVWLTNDVLTRLVGANTRARLALRFRQSRLNRRSAPRAEMPAQVRRELEEALRLDVERLSTLLERDLTRLWFGPSIR